MKHVIASILFAGLFAAPAASAETWVVRQDGVRFTNEVGAACGALDTDVFFQPGETSLEIHDEAPLDYLADCFTRGELANAQIGIVGNYDGTDLGAAIARERLRSVIDYLIARGVSPYQLAMWWQRGPREDDGGGRVTFELVSPELQGTWWITR